MGSHTPTTKNRAERRAEASNAKHDKPLDHRNVRAAFDETPTSPVGEREVTFLTLIWEPELCRQLGRCKATLDRWVRQSRFPPPINVNGQSKAWRVRDIEAWLNKLARSRKRIKRRGSLMQGSELVEQR